MFRRIIVLLAAAGASLPLPLAAQTVKIGLINSYTGFVAQPADQGQKGFDLYVKLHEKDLPQGVKIELLRRERQRQARAGRSQQDNHSSEHSPLPDDRMPTLPRLLAILLASNCDLAPSVMSG